MTKNKNLCLTRLTAWLLAFALILGLFPVNSFIPQAIAADAGEPTAPDAVTLTEIQLERNKDGIAKYDSPLLGERVMIHEFKMADDSGKEYTALCADHGKAMGDALKDDQWVNKTPITVGKSKPFLDFLYYNYYNDIYDWWSLRTFNIWVQMAFWCDLSGVLDSFDENKLCEEIAREREAVFDFYGQENVPGASLELIKTIYQEWKDGKFGDFDYYLYEHPEKHPDGRDVQRVLIAIRAGRRRI